jgi:hypothetical protein
VDDHEEHQEGARLKTLGEIRVEERDNCVALIVRTTRRWLSWDAWVIVNCETFGEKRGYDDPTYGAEGFAAHRPMQRFYVDDILYYAKKAGSRRSQDSAAKKACKELDRFLERRDKLKEIEQQMNDEAA